MAQCVATVLPDPLGLLVETMLERRNGVLNHLLLLAARGKHIRIAADWMGIAAPSAPSTQETLAPALPRVAAFVSVPPPPSRHSVASSLASQTPPRTPPKALGEVRVVNGSTPARGSPGSPRGLRRGSVHMSPRRVRVHHSGAGSRSGRDRSPAASPMREHSPRRPKESTVRRDAGKASCTQHTHTQHTHKVVPQTRNPSPSGKAMRRSSTTFSTPPRKRSFTSAQPPPAPQLHSKLSYGGVSPVRAAVPQLRNYKETSAKKEHAVLKRGLRAARHH
eukprot:TRINITY_DN14461_c0_g1_i1.p1 TRINITY_DN14461_c0_g1~~TRINITY_DN14461_c0_g1_i1.p1  ORF type:complete len:294 (+),score=63.45 TRINITY_DN14461_c0_g1_i1:52-882(+)